jgi:glycine cleavage system H protein
MKELEELILPDDIRYSEDHEWVRIEDDFAYIGISDFAQDQLGDIVFVEMPEVGDSFDLGDEFGSLESVKAVSEMFIPMAGEVVEINEELSESPELLNSDSYDNWIIKIRFEDLEDYDQMLDAEAYLESLDE